MIGGVPVLGCASPIWFTEGPELVVLRGFSTVALGCCESLSSDLEVSVVWTLRGLDGLPPALRSASSKPCGGGGIRAGLVASDNLSLLGVESAGSGGCPCPGWHCRD